MKSKVLLGLFILMLSLSGCITEYFVTLTNQKPMLFVAGDIVANTDAIFYITQSFALNVDTVPDKAFVNNAILQVIDSNENVIATAVSLGRGRYQIRIGDLRDDVSYGIRIEHDGDIFESALSRPLRTPEVDVRWRQYEPLGAVYFYLSTHDETSENNFFLWHYDEIWEVQTPVQTSLFLNPQTSTFFTSHESPHSICWKRNAAYELGSTEALAENRIIDQQLFRIEPESETDRFYWLYSVTVTQKAVSQGSFEFHQNMKVQNEEMGGIFTPQPAEVLGNIRCITNPSRRVMGYINTLKNVSRQRIFIHRFELIWPVIDWCGSRPCSVLPPDLFWSPDFYYSQGFRPVGENFPPEFWMSAACVDCREDGGTTEKPYFWPNTRWQGLEFCP